MKKQFFIEVILLTISVGIIGLISGKILKEINDSNKVENYDKR